MNLWLLSFLLVISSCSSYVRTLGTRMISPEAQGELGAGSMDFRYQGFQYSRMDFSNDSVTNPLEPDVVSNRLGLEAELGIFPRLDLYILPSLMRSPTIYGVKFQVLGDPRKSAKKGNFSASLIGGYGDARVESETEGLTLDNVRRIKADHQHLDAGLLLGYRWTDSILNYASALYLDESLKGNVTTASGGLTDAPYQFGQYGALYSLGLIFYTDRVQYKLDYSHMLTRWSRSVRISTNTLNAAIGFTW
jgi:hypothetical protein